MFRRGPLFHNLVLADEVNRAPAKVQSALLEAMGERQITVGSVTYPLPTLFLVMATQNPIEQEGTYPLPEAQLDRFLLHVRIDYPDAAGERAILALNRAEQKRAATDEELFTAPEVVTQTEVLGGAARGARSASRRAARGIHRADRARDARAAALRRRPRAACSSTARARARRSRSIAARARTRGSRAATT